MKDGVLSRERYADVAAVGRPEPAQFCDKSRYRAGSPPVRRNFDAAGDVDARCDFRKVRSLVWARKAWDCCVSSGLRSSGMEVAVGH